MIPPLYLPSAILFDNQPAFCFMYKRNRLYQLFNIEMSKSNQDDLNTKPILQKQQQTKHCQHDAIQKQQQKQQQQQQRKQQRKQRKRKNNKNNVNRPTRTGQSRRATTSETDFMSPGVHPMTTTTLTDL